MSWLDGRIDKNGEVKVKLLSRKQVAELFGVGGGGGSFTVKKNYRKAPTPSRVVSEN